MWRHLLRTVGNVIGPILCLGVGPFPSRPRRTRPPEPAVLPLPLRRTAPLRWLLPGIARLLPRQLSAPVVVPAVTGADKSCRDQRVPTGVSETSRGG